MELTIPQAAALAGRSPRAMRQWARSGRIPAKRRGRTWVIRLDDLPLTESQREAARQRAARAHAIVDDVTPGRQTGRAQGTRRSILDLDAFRVARDVAQQLRKLAADDSSDPAALRAAGLIRAAAVAIGVGVHEFDRRRSATCFGTARQRLARAAALLWCTLPAEDSPLAALAVRLEQEVLPQVGGLLRWAERGRREARGEHRSMDRRGPR